MFVITEYTPKLPYNTIHCGVGVSGQNDTNNVTITTTPNRISYLVGQNLMLTCMVVPPVPADANATYSWNCSGCFADGIMTQTISRILTAMDSNSMINCSVTIDGNVSMTDTPFDLQVQGRYLFIS